MKSTKTFTKDNYPSDWWKYLVKGDTVECVANNGFNTLYRPIGSILTIRGNSKFEILYNGINGSSTTSTRSYTHFKPISMKAFTNNSSDDNYEIF